MTTHQYARLLAVEQRKCVCSTERTGKAWELLQLPAWQVDLSEPALCGDGLVSVATRLMCARYNLTRGFNHCLPTLTLALTRELVCYFIKYYVGIPAYVCIYRLKELSYLAHLYIFNVNNLGRFYKFQHFEH